MILAIFVHASDSISDTVSASKNLLRYGKQLSKSLFLILVSFRIFDTVSPPPPRERQLTAQATTLAQCSSCVSAYFAISARHCGQFFNPFVGRPKHRSTIPTVIFTGLCVLSWLHLRIKSRTNGSVAASTLSQSLDFGPPFCSSGKQLRYFWYNPFPIALTVS